MGQRFHARDAKLPLAKAAAYAGLPPRTIRFLSDSGRLPFTTLAGSRRPRRYYALSDLDRVLIEQRRSA